MASITRDCIVSAPEVYIQKFLFSFKYHTRDAWGRRVNHVEYGQILRVSGDGIRITGGIGFTSIKWGIIDDISMIHSLITGISRKCPICEGRGIVTAGFYGSVDSDTFLSSGGTERCRSCAGKGYIESEGENEH